MSQRERRAFWVNTVFGAKTKRGYVQLHHRDWSLQLDTVTARKIAHDILEAAEAADQDHFLMDFASQVIGADERQAGSLLMEFRRWRENQRRRDGDAATSDSGGPGTVEDPKGYTPGSEPRPGHGEDGA